MVPPYRSAYIDILALGVRGMIPCQLIDVGQPFVSFKVGSMASGNDYRTKASKLPEGPNANFGERILIPCQLPDQAQDCWLASSLQIIAYDSRLGGYMPVMLGTSNIDLANIIPWCDKMQMDKKEREKLALMQALSRPIKTRP